MSEMILKKEHFYSNQKYENREQLFEFAYQQLLSEGYIKQSFLEALVTREKQFPTGIETTINYLQENKTMTVFTSRRKWLNKLTKYANEPNSQVTIMHENADGSKIFEVPIHWLKISPPRKSNMTEEQKLKAAERLKKARDKRGL